MDTGELARQNAVAHIETMEYAKQIADILQIEPPNLDGVPNAGGPPVKHLRQRQMVAEFLSDVVWALKTPPDQRDVVFEGHVEEREEGGEPGVTVEGFDKPIVLSELLLAITQDADQRTEREQQMIAWFMERLINDLPRYPDAEDEPNVEPPAQGIEAETPAQAEPPPAGTPEATAVEPAGDPQPEPQEDQDARDPRAPGTVEPVGVGVVGTPADVPLPGPVLEDEPEPIKVSGKKR